MNTPEKMVTAKVQFKTGLLGRIGQATAAHVPAPKTTNTTSAVALEAQIRAAYGNIAELSNKIAKEIKSGKSLDRVIPRMCKSRLSAKASEISI